MYCVKCGTRAEKDQKLCHECGMRLISPEALLKLLKKADLEKKLSQIDQVSFSKSEKSVNAGKIHMDGVSKEAEKPVESKITKKTEKTIVKPAVKAAPVKKESEDKRVTPLLENPAQPKRRSIFDDTSDVPVVQNKTSSKGAMKSAGKQRTNPAVKLPEKKKTVSERQKRDKMQSHAGGQLFFMPDHDETRKKTAAPRRNPSAKRVNVPSGARQRPDRAKSLPRNPAVPVKKARPVQARSSSGGGNVNKTRPKREEESFVEKYLRSIISMMLLTCTVIMMLMWGYATDSGLRTMAEFGLGSRKGYILLGDDCMADGNYKRAVEHYYKALSKKVNYEAGIKLARAYRQTGEAEKETSALLLLMDRYHGTDEAYQRILELFPDPNTRPEKVQNAINMHER